MNSDFYAGITAIVIYFQSENYRVVQHRTTGPEVDLKTISLPRKKMSFIAKKDNAKVIINYKLNTGPYLEWDVKFQSNHSVNIKFVLWSYTSTDKYARYLKMLGGIWKTLEEQVSKNTTFYLCTKQNTK